ncbi:MAG: 3'-5' exonuclease [Verrucomicrobiales bacterium]|jgi:DNA polymerase-3 subunit epsilon|nr:3'-5' exonuclease [Verrucomicrobiales bacterium]|tara:strand:- start:907 stop:1482 length:576 start_codon:yes stop_codon:yes gene_type:complete
MDLKNLEFASIDFESTGHREGIGDEPIQIGIAVMKEFEIDKNSFFRSYIKPSNDLQITSRSQSVHRIKNEQLEKSPVLYELWPKINELLGKRVVVAHGAGTEKRFLRSFPMHGFDIWIDTLQLAKKVLPESTDYSLGALIEDINANEEIKAICPGLDWHDALFDAVASLFLLKKLLTKAEGRLSYQDLLKL